MRIDKTLDKVVIRGRERDRLTTWNNDSSIRWVLNPEMEEVEIVDFIGKPENVERLFQEAFKLSELVRIKKVIVHASNRETVKTLYRIGFRSPFVSSDKLSDTIERLMSLRTICMTIDWSDDDLIVDYTAYAKKYDIQFDNEYGWE